MRAVYLFTPIVSRGLLHDDASKRFVRLCSKYVRGTREYGHGVECVVGVFSLAYLYYDTVFYCSMQDTPLVAFVGFPTFLHFIHNFTDDERYCG